jgi:hypothetical protein
MEIAIVSAKFVFFVGLFTGGFLLLRKFVDHSAMQAHNEVAGFIYAVLGVIYAVLLGFVVVTVWEDFKDAENYIDKESTHAVNLYRNAHSFPEHVEAGIKEAVAAYLHDVAYNDWPALQKSQVSGDSEKSYSNIWKVHSGYIPDTPHRGVWYAETLKELNRFAEARRLRIDSMHYDIHPFMWTVLISGACIIIGFSYLFGTESSKAHTIMVFCLASSICLILVLISTLAHPLSGLIQLSPEPYISALHQVK